MGYNLSIHQLEMGNFTGFLLRLKNKLTILQTIAEKNKKLFNKSNLWKRGPQCYKASSICVLLSVFTFFSCALFVCLLKKIIV